jgi:hypothetical protein
MVVQLGFQEFEKFIGMTGLEGEEWLESQVIYKYSQ